MLNILHADIASFMWFDTVTNLPMAIHLKSTCVACKLEIGSGLHLGLQFCQLKPVMCSCYNPSSHVELFYLHLDVVTVVVVLNRLYIGIRRTRVGLQHRC
jgi:hypothetical protein